MSSVLLFRPIHDPHTRSAPTTPWGLLFVAAPLAARGVEVEIVDECVTPDYRDKVEAILKTKQPVAVGISTMTGIQLKYALRFAQFVREHSSVPIVWGGVHVTILPEQSARHPLVDYVVAGEGEFAFDRLVQCLETHQEPDGVPGVFWRRDGEVRGAKAEDFINLADVPEIPDHLLDVEPYITNRPDLDASRFFEIVTSRGCPHRCGFCYIESVHGSCWRCLEADVALDRIEAHVNRFRLDGILFREDNFFARRSRVEAIAKGIIERGLCLKWSASCRINYLVNYGREFLDLLRRSGCALLTFGVESGSDRLLEYMGKGVSTDMVLTAAALLHEVGIRGTYHFMGGAPTESDEDLVATCRLIERIRHIAPESVIREMSMFTPYPGVRLVQDCIAAGYREPDNLQGWTDIDWRFTRSPWLAARHARLISDVQFLIARLSHPNPVVRRWVHWRWRQLLASTRGICVPERPLIQAGRSLLSSAQQE